MKLDRAQGNSPVTARCAFFSHQLFFGGPDGAWGYRAIGVDTVAQKYDGSGITVAVLDTGVDRNHPALRVSAGLNFVPDESSDDWRDDYGHGTFVAGVVAGAASEAGPVGVSPGVRLLAGRIGRFNEDTHQFDNDPADALSRALQWAIGVRADIVNLSLEFTNLGGGQESFIESQLAEATRQGIVVVCAAGNDKSAQVSYPASSRKTLSVGALGDLRQIPTEVSRASDSSSGYYIPLFSNYGQRLDVVAPGVRIVSTIPTRQGSYGWQLGTSVAAPFVTGMCALLMQADSRNRVRSAPYVRRICDAIKGSARPLAGCEGFQGNGLVDVQRALSALSEA